MEPLRLLQGLAANALDVLDANTAWIVLGWTIESTREDDPVLRARDAGGTWDRLGEIHEPHSYVSFVESLVFENPSVGHCAVRYDDLDPDADEAVETVFTTGDAGRTRKARTRADRSRSSSGAARRSAGGFDRTSPRT